MKILVVLLTLTTAWAQEQTQKTILKETEFEQKRDHFGVPTDRELNRRILKLQDQVEELQFRVQHLETQLESSSDIKALPYYQCVIQAELIGRFSARAPSTTEAKRLVTKKCEDNSSDSSLCNESNMNCVEE